MLFPDNYSESRHRFRDSAKAIGARLSAIPVPVAGHSDLTIDVAIIGEPGQSTVVLSSGLHGVEGYCGAAIQLAWLARQKTHPAAGRFVVVHALNPFGYSQDRRVNEDNVDLNRNFRDPHTTDSGELVTNSPDYARFDGLLNPASPPRRLDGFYLKALGHVLREGEKKLQSAIVTGQYEFEKGLFYGGKQRCQSVKVVQENIKSWIAGAPEMCHIDFHTGLGAFAQCQLLVQTAGFPERHAWYANTFGTEHVVSTDSSTSNVYEASGAMGSWLIKKFSDRPYRFLTAEFGTYSPVKILGALRTENQAYHFTSPESTARKNARVALRDCFCPSSTQWRASVVERGLDLVARAEKSLQSTG